MEDNEGDLDVLTSLLEEGSPLSNDEDGGDTRVNGDDLHDDGDAAQHSGGPHPSCSNKNGTEAELSALFDAEDDDAEDSDALVIDIGEPEGCGDEIRKADGDVPAPRRSAVSTPRCDDGKENVRLEEKSKEELAEELRLMQEKVLRLQQQLQETSPQAASSGVSSQRKVGVKKTEAATTAYVKTKSRLAHQPKSGESSTAFKDRTKIPTASQAGACSQSPMSVTASTSAAGGATAGKRKAPTTLSTPTTASSSSGMQENTEVEKYSGFRIRRPLISSVDMERRMAGRRMIRLSQLPDKITRDSLDNIDWVTIGVIVHKHTPQSVSSGKTFSVWRLMDLKNMEVSVSLLLFGEVHKQHWKTDQGFVVGLLNPTLMKPKEGYNELSISVDHPQKVMLMGEAKDLGTCRAAKRNGDPCTQLINLMEGEFCQFHVQSQYRKMSSRRSELQAGFTGREPTMLRGRGRGALGLKERICQQGFHYGGVSSPAYAASVASSTPSKGSKSTQMSLSGFVVRGADAVLLQAKQNLGMGPSSGSVTGCSEDFQGLLKAPTPGALNLKKHLVQISTTGADGKPRANMQSISAAELIRQQKRGLQDARRKRSEDREAKLLQIADAPSASCHEANPSTPTGTTERPVRPEPGGSMSSSPIPSPSTSASVRTPRIGSGLRDGDEVFLFDSPPQPNKQASNADRKKLAAVHKLRANGKQLEKQNPNAVKRKVAGETVRAVLQRTEEDTASSPEEQGGQEPASKRARRNSELFNSPEFQQLLAARSKHSDKVRQAEDDLQEQYFNVREKKEQMEEKMKNLKEQKCRVVSCKQCKYTHYKALDTCVQQMHALSWHDGVKRFFRCGQCSHRTVSLDRLPQKHCKNCGQFKWERDSMLKERKGPKIGAETLLPRGEEQAKFLNSLA
ncbi:protein MCM10 homolog [Petromyzon marinus]|uniref:protein MCM10 homolog n=1 Tax=Petromyzon marinus TaxID=7757 RepID=UPI003F726E44